MIDQNRALDVSPELGEREELPLLRALLRSSDYGVLFSNADRRDIVCNRRFVELFGVDGTETVRSAPEMVRAMVLPRLKDPETFVRELDHIYANPQLTCEDEIELVDPRSRVIRRYTTPVVDEGGVILGRLWTFLDITNTRLLERKVEGQAARLKVQAAQLSSALKDTSGRLHKTEVILEKAERQLLESEKLSAAGLLAASVAHDIGNILTPLSIEISLADENDPAARSEALNAMKEQVNHLSLLIHRILAFARPTATAQAPVDIPALLGRLGSLLEPQAKLNGLEVAIRCQRDLPPVIGDAAQLEQVFVNLALNGIQAMSAERVGQLSLTATRSNSSVVVQVADAGPGIPPEVRRRLFDPFFTTKPQGAGLGLYSCRRIVLDHSGTIRVRSTPGKGSCFTIKLPAMGNGAASTSEQGMVHDHTGTREQGYGR